MYLGQSTAPETIEPSSAKIPEEFSGWCWVYFTLEANSEMSDTENGTNCLQFEQKELSSSQQITQHMKISQDEQKSHFFQIYECKTKVCPL